jgi:hypothetical protein
MGDSQLVSHTVDYSHKYCIIGAGSSGITAAKNLKQLGIAYDVFEREDGIGGNWYYGKPNSSVYRSTHLDSSKPLTEYSDFLMPKEYPDYPNHVQVLAYFKAYVQHFDLERDIQLNTSVESVTPAGDCWDVGLSTGETRRYRGVIIANGHNWCPKYPQYPGEFTGMKLHSSDYKTPDVLEGKRVLVIGAGNSGCDIAAESASHAVKTFHSTRRGYYYLPRYLMGRPVDQVNELMLKLHVPLSVRRFNARVLYRFVVGDLRRFGVRKPDHRLFETHPIVNSMLPYYIGHGDIMPKPDVKEYCGDRVAFIDGTSEQIDLIIYAKGFRIVFPFMDTSLLNWRKGYPSLYLNVFHPAYDNLFVAGLIQPDSGQFGLVDRQCQLIARFILCQQRNPARADYLRKLKRREQEDYSGGVKYKESTRHYVEVEHYSYRKRLERLLKELSV